MFSLEFDKNTMKIITQAFGASISNSSNLIEAIITNRQKHAVIAEFGSGIYGEGPLSKKQVIKPKKAQTLIIPISTKYARRYGSILLVEAVYNAKKYPQVFNRLRSQMPSVVGFIFRDSMKGMRPLRMVRGSEPKVHIYLQQLLMKSIASGKNYRQGVVDSVNTAAIYWLREIVKKSPVLTGTMRSGWNITKLAV